MSTEPPDEKLMADLAAGDMAALGALVRRHQDALVAFAARMLGRRDLAEDVAQEAFVHVHRAARRYRPEAKFTTWLYRIAANLCRDAQRRASRAPASLDEETAPGRDPGPDPLEARERIERVRRAVAALPERQRLAVTLHRYQGLSHREIAQVAECSESAVESLLVRAYAALRQALADLKE